MCTSSAMESCVLFADSCQTTFVLDIPRSLEHANGGGQAISSLAPAEPYVTPEPKGRKREAFLTAICADEKLYHEKVQLGVEKELKLLHDNNKLSRWCLPRVSNNATATDHERLPWVVLKQDALPAIVLSAENNCFRAVTDLQSVLAVHHSETATKVLLTEGDCFHVPSRSSFIWSDIRRASYVLAILERDIGFDILCDLVLMDPPWPNRSVRHARAYPTADAQRADPFHQALDLATRYLKEEGLIAVWITNKWTIRQNTLVHLAQRGFVLTEQWIWTKVTTKGEPITPLHGLWRKPYEILLIFRRTSPSTIPTCPTSRYIFAVPDLHSRKPNLKSVFDTMFAQPKVLELFARNLTSGWIAVGDDVLKFQNTQMWSRV